MSLPNHLSLLQIAAKLAVTSEALERWLSRGEFPLPTAVLPDDETRWSESEIDAWLQSRRPDWTEAGRELDGRVWTESDGSGRKRTEEKSSSELLSMTEDAEKVFAVLLDAKGGWVKTRRLIDESLGKHVSEDHGPWRRVVQILRSRGMIESRRYFGYRVKPEYQLPSN